MGLSADICSISWCNSRNRQFCTPISLEPSGILDRSLGAELFSVKFLMVLKFFSEAPEIHYFATMGRHPINEMWGRATSVDLKNRLGPVPGKDMHYAAPPPSVLLPFSWKMRTVLNRVKNQFSDFCDLQFLRYSRFCTQNW